MEWFYPKRRVPEWKQRGLTVQTRASVSAPSIHLLLIFGVVVCLLWFSHYNEHRAQFHHTAINLQLFLLLLPVLLVFFTILYSSSGRFNFRLIPSECDSLHRAGVFPWSVAILVLLLFVLLAYQSSFHSKWFGTFGR